MTTSNGPAPSNGRVPLRLSVSERPGEGTLDGGWWPQSRDLKVELVDLVDNFPPRGGRITRVIFSPPDWDPAPPRVPVRHGYIKVGSVPYDDTHVVILKTSDRKDLCFLVIPPDMSPGQGAEALMVAASPGYRHSAASLLATVAEHTDVEAGDEWTDGGEKFWGPDEVAPSFRKTT